MSLKRRSLNDKRWLPSKKQVVDERLKAYNDRNLPYSEAFKRILSRKLTESVDPETFLHPSLEQLHNPFLLKGMERAVARIQQAVASNQSIWIYGDYDVDGITSVSLLIRAFKQLGHYVHYYIPDRHEEGYGLNGQAIEHIASLGGQVIITVDCGITSVKEANLAKALDVDLIITDHHECQSEIPQAYAVINPKQQDCSYPYPMLAGVGIAYKMASALLGELILPIQESLLELAAFGTIADIAPLDGENRIIAKYGLKSLSESKIIGFKALIECSDLKNKKITAGHVGFMLAPKINAAGRIDDPKQGVVLLTTEDELQAFEIAMVLKETNDRRQELEKEILEAAIMQIESDPSFKNQHVTIAYGENWNSGVIGIVASRLVEKYHKPTLVFSLTDGKAKASARSVEGFDIFEALCAFTDQYEKFGGHEQAAGLTLLESKFFKWKEDFQEYCKRKVEEYQLIPAIHIDEVLTSADVTYGFIEELSLLEPYGMGNARPVFKLENVVIQKKVLLGKHQEFTKFEVADGIRTFEAISFDKSGYYPKFKPGDLVDLICHIDVNEFKGTQTIQFQLKDMRGYREELSKLAGPIEQFNASLAKKIIMAAKENNLEVLKPVSFLKDEAGELPNSRIFTVSTLEGLYYFYNKLYDERLKKVEVVHCSLKQEQISQADKIWLILNPVHVKSLDRVIPVEEKYDIIYQQPSLKQYEQWIPDRDMLIDFYKAVRAQVYETKLPQDTSQWLCAFVLEDANLIEIGEEGLVLLPSPSGKIDLMERPVFKTLQLLKISLKNH